MNVDLPVLLAETNIYGLLFFIALIVLEYVVPYLRRRKQQSEGGEDEEGDLSPGQEDALVRRLREAADAAQQAAREAMAEDKPAPTPANAISAGEQRRRNQARVEAAGDRLREAAAAWRSAASAVLDSRTAERLVALVRDRFGDFEGSVSHWSDADVEAAQTAAGVLVDAAAAVEPLQRPGRRLLWRAVESLTDRVLETAPASDETDELTLIPLARQLTSSRTMTALESARLVPVLMPSGTTSPRHALALMITALREVMEWDARDERPIVAAAIDHLAREVNTGARLAAALVDFLRSPDARRILGTEIPTALAMHHTGPLAGLLYGADGMEQIGPQAALMRREAYASSLITSDLVHDDPALAVWDVIAASLVEALSATGYGGPMASSLWVMIEPWGPAEESQAQRTADWLREGATAAAPARVVDPIAALVAWALVGKLDVNRLQHLANAVDGTHQAVVAVAPVERGWGETAADRVRPSTEQTWREAMILQMVLGPPRARLGPQRVPSIWGRRPR